jgi:predicted GNAT family N-acyltransferase
LASRQDETLRFEALHPAHDRSGFSCGVPDLDTYLRERANQDAHRRVASTFVLLGYSSVVLGYYTLSQQVVSLEDVPSELSKKLPKYPLLPATLVGRLALDGCRQGEGLGSLLLLDALLRSWQTAQTVASCAVRVDATDEKAQTFYLQHDFIPFSNERLKLFIPMTALDRLFADET